jgi:hypothetical protein
MPTGAPVIPAEAGIQQGAAMPWFPDRPSAAGNDDGNQGVSSSSQALADVRFVAYYRPKSHMARRAENCQYWNRQERATEGLLSALYAVAVLSGSPKGSRSFRSSVSARSRKAAPLQNLGYQARHQTAQPDIRLDVQSAARDGAE